MTSLLKKAAHPHKIANGAVNRLVLHYQAMNDS